MKESRPRKRQTASQQAASQQAASQQAASQQAASQQAAAPAPEEAAEPSAERAASPESASPAEPELASRAASSAEPAGASAAASADSTPAQNSAATSDSTPAAAGPASASASASAAARARAAKPVAAPRLEVVTADDSDEWTEDSSEETGLSLEELSQTYAQLLGQGAVPYQQPEEGEAAVAAASEEPFDPLAEELTENDQCPITPLSILEALLFVGRPDSEPISAEEVAGMMRGVRTVEIEQLSDELNEIYQRAGHALRVVASGSGYRMQLAPEFSNIGERFYGRVREAKLTQAAIDCLAIIAYRPGITRESLEEQRGQPSGGVLNQLVRRQLIEIRRGEGKTQRSKHYYPTERLLQLVGLESLDELPLADDFDR
jgi:segregation and condensation protein B